MGRMPNLLRVTIARNIRACRLKKYPGRGGSKQCAEDFGVSPQQWSPWERGMRTPSEERLSQIAEFFGVTVEWFRKDHGKTDRASHRPNSPSAADTPFSSLPYDQTLLFAVLGHLQAAMGSLSRIQDDCVRALRNGGFDVPRRGMRRRDGRLAAPGQPSNDVPQ